MRVWQWIVLSAALIGPAAAPVAAAESSPAETNRLLAKFRAAAKDPDRRAELVGQAIQSGPVALSALFSVVSREMAPELKRYTAKLYQKAGPLARKKLAKAPMTELARLRLTVLALQQSAEFSHELIAAKGTPALKQLEEMCVIDRRDLLDQTPGLKDDRRKLFAQGRLWERCAVALYERLPDDQNKPKEPPSFENFLQGEEALAAGLATPMDPVTRGVLAANARLATQLDPEEAKTILALNLTRNLLGLSAVAIDLKLCAAARDHSADMQKLNFFAHESPVEGKRSPWDRAKRFGASASAENIALGCHDGKHANQMWFESPGHHRNMLARHARVGVGRAGVHYTEMFGD